MSDLEEKEGERGKKKREKSKERGEIRKRYKEEESEKKETFRERERKFNTGEEDRRVTQQGRERMREG